MPSTAIRRKPRQERARETMERLLESAARVLERDGLDGFSVDKTAAEAGMAVGTAYQYFSDKYDILLQLLQRWYDRTEGLHDDSIETIIDRRAEIYFSEPSASQLLNAARSIPRLHAYDLEVMKKVVHDRATALAHGGVPTPEQIARVRVLTFAIDAVLRDATDRPEGEAKLMVQSLKDWARALGDYPAT